jgi:UDP-glucuronate 4-epimerase
MKVLVTGAAGFIGMHVSQRLLARGDTVIGLDNLNEFYDPQLKRDRLSTLARAGFTFVKVGVGDRGPMYELFASERFDRHRRR